MTKTMFLGVERIDDPTEWSSWNINLRPSTALPAATRLSAARIGLGPIRIATEGAPERRLNSRGSLPTAWVSVVFGMGAPDSELPAAFQEGTNVAGNPLIRVQTRTALNLGEMS